MASGTFFALTCLAVTAGTAGAHAQTSAAPTENKGFKDVELRSMNLGPEIESIQGYKLRLRRLTLEPGGVIALHDHAGRPTINYVVKGSVVTRSPGKPDEIVPTGGSMAKGKDDLHWVENRGAEPAELIAVEVAK